MKIKKWKDKHPQYVAKNGFSKRNINLNQVYNKEYFERFLLETCRAEWNHFMCCMYFVISFLINKFPFSIIFSIIPLVANLPFLIIQRYNRIRFLNFNLKKSVLQKIILTKALKQAIIRIDKPPQLNGYNKSLLLISCQLDSCRGCQNIKSAMFE